MKRLTVCSLLGWVALFPVLLLTACEHKDLCYMHPHFTTVRVTFDWKAIDDRDRPDGMRVVFYPRQGGETWVFDFPGGKGGTVEIPEGDYDVASFNYDTEMISWRNEGDYATFMADTREAEAPDKTPVCVTPDYLCGDHLDGIHLKDLRPGTETVVPVFPERMVCRYTYEVNGIRNLGQVADLRAGLSGMSGALWMATDRLPENLSESLLFGGAVSGGQIKGGFYTFGCCRKAGERHVFKLYVKSRAGRMYMLEKDVTDQVNRVPVVGHVGDVHLVIDFDYEIPDKPVGGDDSGFEVDADEWIDVNEDIFI